MQSSLFGYPGNKRRYISHLNLEGCTELIEPFAGSCAVSIHAIKSGIKKFRLADHDNTLTAVIACCIDMNLYQQMYSYILETKQHFLIDQEYTWKYIKDQLSDRWHQPVATEDLPVVAALKVVFQRVTHGCIPRTCNTSNKLNVIASKNKIKNLAQWKIDVPKLYEYLFSMDIHNSWEDCYKIPVGKAESTVVFIDPPYCAPGKSGCYPGHQPGKWSTMVTIMNSLEQGLQLDVNQVYLTAYDCGGLNDFCHSMASHYGYSLRTTELGKLETLDRGSGNFRYGRRTTVNYKYGEVLWEFHNKQFTKGNVEKKLSNKRESQLTQN